MGYSACLDVAFDELAGFGVHADGARAEDEPVGLDCLAVDAWEGFGRLCSKDRSLGHVDFLFPFIILLLLFFSEIRDRSFGVGCWERRPVDGDEEVQDIALRPHPMDIKRIPLLYLRSVEFATKEISYQIMIK